MTFPGTTQRCARCGLVARWRIDSRGRVTAIDEEPVLGGRIELIGETEFFDRGVGIPTVEGGRYHSEVCS